jgi:Leucine-rich repeat (LRR) protein
MLNAGQGGTTAALSDAARVRDALTLTRLNLSNDWLFNSHIKTLAKSPYLASVTYLDLSHNNIGVPGVRALAESPYLRSLVRLNLSQNPNVRSRVKAREILEEWRRRQAIEIDY